MLTFACPSCGAKLQAAESNAGKKIKCPKCQQIAAVPKPEDDVPADAIEEVSAPMPPDEDEPTAVTTPENAKSAKRKRRAEEDDEEDDAPRRRRRRDEADEPKKSSGMKLFAIIAAVVCVAGCCLVGTLGALLVPAVQKVREAATRTQSTNNLKQIGLAFHSFHDVNRRMPFNGTKPAVSNDPKSGSWAFQILPYIEQQGLYAAPNPFAGVATFMDPGRGRPAIEIGRGAWTDYFLNNYLNDPMKASNPANTDQMKSLINIADGTSNTVLVGQGSILLTQYQQSNNVTLSTTILNGGTPGTMRAGNNGKSSPTGVFISRDSNVPPTIGSWGGPFPQGGLMAMGDASVRLFPYTTGNFGQFLTPTGGEPVILPDS